MNKFNFGPAFENERIVFGASRPGYPSKQVGINRVLEWISFMKDEDIKRICCLLTQTQFSYYEGQNLLSIYQGEFRQDHVASVEIEDYHLCDTYYLTERILPFLNKSDIDGEKVVVHCSGGIGRTGFVLAAWLVYKYGLSEKKALAAVVKSGRNPFEAVECGNATMDELYNLLRQCQKGNSPS